MRSPVRTICGQGGSGFFTSTLFGAKYLQFFARARREGVESVRTFFGQGKEEAIFRDFVQTSFMDGPKQKQ